MCALWTSHNAMCCTTFSHRWLANERRQWSQADTRELWSTGVLMYTLRHQNRISLRPNLLWYTHRQSSALKLTNNVTVIHKCMTDDSGKRKPRSTSVYGSVSVLHSVIVLFLAITNVYHWCHLSKAMFNCFTCYKPDYQLLQNRTHFFWKY